MKQLERMIDIFVVGPTSKGYPMVMPRVVELQINYFQIDKGRKRIVNAQIDFHEQCVVSIVQEDIDNAAANGLYYIYYLQFKRERLTSVDFYIYISV
jgi:hypothetical protein